MTSKLGGRRRDKLTSVREPGDEGTLQDVDVAVDGSRSVAYGMKVSIQLELVMFKL